MRRVGNPLARNVSTVKFVRLVRILDRHLESDAPTGIIPIRSLRGFTGCKVSGTTKGRPWSVTLFGGNFYLVRIHGLEDSKFHTPLHVLNYLRAHLPR